MDRVFFNPKKEATEFDQATVSGGSTRQYNQSYKNGLPMVMPVSLKLSTWADWWTVPIEPLVSVSGGNIIAKRTVAKGKHRGSIKERWAQDDYQVTLEGSLINRDSDYEMPEADIMKLREVCEAKEAVQIQCDMLKVFDIYKIVVETYDFPHTSGDNRQSYSIKAVSDDLTDALMEEDQL
jgi:hypothetical protein